MKLKGEKSSDDRTECGKVAGVVFRKVFNNLEVCCFIFSCLLGNLRLNADYLYLSNLFFYFSHNGTARH